MNKIKRYQRKSTVPFCFELDDAEPALGWTCLLIAKQFPGDTASVSRVVTATGDKWEGFLTVAETTAMALGLWFLTAVLTNTSTGEVQEKQDRFGIAKTWSD